MEKETFVFSSSPGMAAGLLHTRVQTRVTLNKSAAEVESSSGRARKRAVIPCADIESVSTGLHISGQYILYAVLAAGFGIYLGHWVFGVFAAAMLLRGINRRIKVRWGGDKEIKLFSAGGKAAEALAGRLRERAACSRRAGTPAAETESKEVGA